jgi:hypothetical protein
MDEVTNALLVDASRPDGPIPPCPPNSPVAAAPAIGLWLGNRFIDSEPPINEVLLETAMALRQLQIGEQTWMPLAPVVRAPSPNDPRVGSNPESEEGFGEVNVGTPIGQPWQGSPPHPPATIQGAGKAKFIFY